MQVRQVHPDALMMGLKRVYERYCSWHNGMNREAMDKVCCVGGGGSGVRSHHTMSRIVTDRGSSADGSSRSP